MLKKKICRAAAEFYRMNSVITYGEGFFSAALSITSRAGGSVKESSDTQMFPQIIPELLRRSSRNHAINISKGFEGRLILQNCGHVFKVLKH